LGGGGVGGGGGGNQKESPLMFNLKRVYTLREKQNRTIKMAKRTAHS